MVLSGKKYRIKSERRFTVFVTVVVALLVITVNTFLGLHNASGLTQREYIEIEVEYGDNLWNIANEYMAYNGDVRKSVHILCNINGISAHELKAGQVLLVPVKTI